MRNNTMGPASALALGLAASLAVAACDRKDDKPSAAASATAAETASAAPSAAAAASAAPSASAVALAAKPLCKVEEEKVLGKGANTRTGLTLTDLGAGRRAIGVAMGNRPFVVSVDKEGEATLVKVDLAKDGALATGIKPAEGRRDLQRVTPALTPEGKLVAFADHRDKYLDDKAARTALSSDRKRRIACLDARENDGALVFEGEPLVRKLGLVGPEEAPAAPSAAPAGSGSAAPSASAAPAAAPTPKPDGKVHVELRDCRTHLDRDTDSAWGSGSELVAKPNGDSWKWSMRLFVHRGKGKGRTILADYDLGAAPKKLYTLEAPVAHRLPGGGYILAGRYKGSMKTWVLDANKNVQGGRRTYSGGWYTIARFFDDPKGVWLLTARKADEHYGVRFLQLGKGDLPSDMSDVELKGEGDLAEPTVATVGEQRWLAYHAGTRRGGTLKVVPVDADLKVQGAFTRITEGATATESMLLGLESGKLVVVYIRRQGKSTELVSARLACETPS